jgi:hypothetical protein
MRLTSLLFCVVEVSLLLVLYKYYYAAVHHVFHGLNFVTIILLYVLDCGCFQDVFIGSLTYRADYFISFCVISISILCVKFRYSIIPSLSCCLS